MAGASGINGPPRIVPRRDVVELGEVLTQCASAVVCVCLARHPCPTFDTMRGANENYITRLATCNDHGLKSASSCGIASIRPSTVNTEAQIATDVERQLGTLLLTAPTLSELPIAPLRDIGDLVRLEIALKRFAEIHRSKRSKMLVGSVRRILRAARNRLQATTASAVARFPDTQPAQL